MPKSKDITSQKQYSDIIYGYLQTNSVYDEQTGIRMVDKRTSMKTHIAAAFGITRQTVATKINKLKDLGLIEETSNGIRLIEIPANKAFLIPFNTLRKLTSAFNENAISVYVYLFNRYIANGEQSFDFTATQLKTFCGLGTNTHSNNYIIEDILSVLAATGLIKFSQVTKSRDGVVTTCYELSYIGFFTEV